MTQAPAGLPPARPSAALFTIGYQATTVDRLIASLLDAGVAAVADVRAVPQSRKPGFSKRGLGASLAEAGIGYAHLRPLGTPKDGRIAARRGDAASLARIYEAHLDGDAAQVGFADAVTLSRATPTCLLCFERDHEPCHRSLVAARIVAATGATVRHLRPQASVGTVLPER